MVQIRPDDGMQGNLPARAPRANPYVPFQGDNPPTYEARKAIKRGTLFPGLDLPFMGMINQKELPATPQAELQTLAFAINELGLYLDTHRDDTEALQMYRAYQKMYEEGKARYEKEYGPMNHMSVAGEKYRWLDDPWPWEYSANREG